MLQWQKTLGQLFGGAPTATPSMSLDIYEDSASRTRELMTGGWLVELAAQREGRARVEEWQSLATDRAWASRNDEAEREGWYAVASDLAVILSITQKVFEAGGPPQPRAL